jgi:predicted ATPase
VLLEALILHDFRCFAGYQEVPLRPVTLLVGENSSGKTSFLAATRIVDQMRFAGGPPDFNAEPFLLGAYDELANYKGGRAGRAEAFVLGSKYTRPANGASEAIALTNTAEFVKFHAQPMLKHYLLMSDGYIWHMQFVKHEGKVVVRTPRKSEGVEVRNDEYEAEPWSIIRLNQILLEHGGLPDELDATEKKQLARLVAPMYHHAPTYAAAPIRAQPKRTYELLNDLPRPQGEHVPMLLAQIYGQHQWDELRDPLEAFAHAAGLFENISVRRLGKSESSPFQILVRMGGPSRNLVDVGYGVSQILPLLVDLLRDKRQRTYLIQQPEVHLHPRAQAELAPLLGTIAKTHSKQLLIETHSDYLIDRFRMQVRDKKLKPSDVVVLYFERLKGDVIIHPMKLDERGNLLNVPSTYRQFFLEEEKRFLGVG